MLQASYAWIPQQEAADCGVAALVMVARSHGQDVTLSEVRQGTRVGPRGASLSDLREAAVRLGFLSRAVRIGMAEFAAMPLPAIAHLDGGHYVVVYALAEDGVVVGDPAIGVLKWDFAAFRRIWTGVLLLLEPTDHQSAKS